MSGQRSARINYAKKFEPPVPAELKGTVKTTEEQSKGALAELFPFNSSIMNHVSLAKISQREAKSRKPLIAK